ncbi:MAG: hypothetical protein LBP60_02145 [Spirochaetaceae bacterium]|nr:hypothetical protein [Spirochaetaceae bacterium]
MIFMDRKNLLRAASVLCALFLVVLSGCKTDPSQPIDSRLIGDWTNDKSDSESLSKNETRNFTIGADGSFTCSINPADQGRGTVTGILSAAGDEYIMSSMQGTAPVWGGTVGGQNGTYVQIEFDGNDTFEFKCADKSEVAKFFGGTYYRLP